MLRGECPRPGAWSCLSVRGRGGGASGTSTRVTLHLPLHRQQGSGGLVAVWTLAPQSLKWKFLFWKDLGPHVQGCSPRGSGEARKRVPGAPPGCALSGGSI